MKADKMVVVFLNLVNFAQHALLTLAQPKGQFIAEYLFDVLDFPTDKNWLFAKESKKWSNRDPGQIIRKRHFITSLKIIR